MLVSNLSCFKVYIFEDLAHRCDNFAIHVARIVSSYSQACTGPLEITLDLGPACGVLLSSQLSRPSQQGSAAFCPHPEGSYILCS